MKLLYTLFAATAVLITLKLTGVIVWSWWWITVPIWAPVLLALVLVILFYQMLNKYRKL